MYSQCDFIVSSLLCLLDFWPYLMHWEWQSHEVTLCVHDEPDCHLRLSGITWLCHFTLSIWGLEASTKPMMFYIQILFERPTTVSSPSFSFSSSVLDASSHHCSERWRSSPLDRGSSSPMCCDELPAFYQSQGNIIRTKEGGVGKQ